MINFNEPSEEQGHQCVSRATFLKESATEMSEFPDCLIMASLLFFDQQVYSVTVL
jgi:hypothetical protein